MILELGLATLVYLPQRQVSDLHSWRDERIMEASEGSVVF